MKIFCRVTTPTYKEWADRLGLPSKYITNVVGAWCSENGFEDPTLDQLKEFMDANEKEADTYQNYTPDFEYMSIDPEIPADGELVKIGEDYKIKVAKLPEDGKFSALGGFLKKEGMNDSTINNILASVHSLEDVTNYLLYYGHKLMQKKEQEAAGVQVTSTDNDLGTEEFAASNFYLKSKLGLGSNTLTDNVENSEGDTVGASPVAAGYLFEGGPGTIKTTGYLLNAIGGAFQRIGQITEEIKKKYIDKLDSDPAKFKKDETGALQELQTAVFIVYGKTGIRLLNNILNNATGYLPKQGKDVAKAVEELEKMRDIKDKVVQLQLNEGIQEADPKSGIQPEDKLVLESRRPSDVTKAAHANKFIGYTSHNPNSHIAEYAKQFESKVNTNDYKTGDFIYVGILGTPSSASEERKALIKQDQDRTIEEAVAALRQGAVLITDSIRYTANSKDITNTGEQRLAAFLTISGAKQDTEEIQGIRISKWYIPASNSVSENNGITGLSALQKYKTGGLNPQNIDKSQIIKSIEDATKPSFPKMSIDLKDSDLSRMVKDFPNATTRRLREEFVGKLFSYTVAHEGKDATKKMLTEQINAILKGRDFKALSNKEKKEAGRLMKLKDKLDDTEQMPVMVINLLGVEKLVELTKSIINRRIQDANNPKEIEKLKKRGVEDMEYYKNEMRKVLYNFNTLLEYSVNYIQKRLGVRIITERIQVEENSQDTVMAGTITENADNTGLEGSVGKEEEDDHEGTKVTNTQLTFQVRQLNPSETLSAKVRKLFGGIIVEKAAGVDADGHTQYETDYDDLGEVRYTDPDLIHMTLLKELSTMKGPDDFATVDNDGWYTVHALEKLKNKYSWADAITNLLTVEKNSDDASLVAMVYSDLRKNFVRRDVVKFGRIYQINAPMGEEEFKMQMMQAYEQRLQPANKDTVWDERGVIRKEALAAGYNLLTLASGYNGFTNNYRGNEEYFTTVCKNYSKALKMLGLDVPAETIKGLFEEREEEDKTTKKKEIRWYRTDTFNMLHSNLRSIFNSYPHVYKTYKNDLINEEVRDQFFRYNSKKLQKVYEVVATLVDTYAAITVHEGKQTYQNYVAPCYCEDMIDNLTVKDASREARRRRKEYIEKEFMPYEWFYDHKNNKWRNEWLELMYEDEHLDNENSEGMDSTQHNASFEILFGKSLELREVPQMQGLEYEDWSEQGPSFIPTQNLVMYADAYFAKEVGGNKAGDMAWHTIPALSDSPVCKQILAPREKLNPFDAKDFEDNILRQLRNVAKQELYRIDLVKRRNENGASVIGSFDVRGLDFCLLPYLNPVKDQLLELWNNKNEEKQKELDSILDEVLKAYLNTETATFLNSLNWDKEDDLGLYQLLKDKFEPLYKNKEGKFEISDEQFKDLISEISKEYVWNHAIVTAMVYELFITDPAFHSSDTDLQKRFKEIYAAGTKLFVHSRYGKEYQRTIYLKDIIRPSRFLNPVHKLLQQCVTNKTMTQAEVNDIFDKFKEINLADAQAFRHFDSYRSVIDMVGRWTPEMQRCMDNIKNGKGTYKDLTTVFQTIKPFLYTQIAKLAEAGVDGEFIKVPHQNKDSEFLLMTLYALTSDFHKSPLLRGLESFMGKNNIDVSIFNSGVKSGVQGPIDIGIDPEKMVAVLKGENNEWMGGLDGAKAMKLRDMFTEHLIENLVKDYAATISKEEPNREMEDIMEETKQAVDYILNDDRASFVARCNSDTFNDAMKKVLDETFKGKEPLFDDDTLNAFYDAVEPDEETVERILDTYTHKRDAEGDFIMENGNKVEDKTVIHEFPYKDYCIQQPTPEHLMDAKSIFGSQFKNLILSDIPDTFKFEYNGKTYDAKETVALYQELMTENLLEGFAKVKDIFSDIRKTKEFLESIIQGNPRYGKDIHEAIQIVEIIGENGKPKEVFNMPFDNPTMQEKIEQIMLSAFKNKITKQYIRGGNAILVSSVGYTSELKILYNEDGSWDGVECYLPAHTRKMYEEALVEKRDDEGNFIGYVLDPNKIDDKSVLRGIGYRIPTEAKYSMVPLIIKGFLSPNQGSAIMYPPEIFMLAGEDCDIDKKFLMLPQIEVKNGKCTMAKYDNTLDPWNNTREQRDNMIFEISYAILTNEEVMRQAHNPGSFDELKYERNRAFVLQSQKNAMNFIEFMKANDKVLEEVKDNEGNMTKAINTKKFFDLLDNTDTKTLKKFQAKYREVKDPLSIMTFSYFHNQNMTGGKLIGVYAINQVIHSKLIHTNIELEDSYTFTLNNKLIKSLHDVTINENGVQHYISTVCARPQAASVDNVKDPVLADLMQNMRTAPIMGFLELLGVDNHTICAMFTNPAVKKAILYDMDFQQMKDDIINNWSEKHKGEDRLENPILSEINLNVADIEKATFNRNVLGQYDRTTVSTTLKVLTIMQEMEQLATEFRKIVRMTRADSPNGAVDISTAGMYEQIRNARVLQRRMTSPNYAFRNVADLIDYGMLDKANEEFESLRKKFNKQKLPAVQAAFTLGIESASSLLKDYFIIGHPTVRTMLDEMNDECSGGVMYKTGVIKFIKGLVNYCLSDTPLFGASEDKEGVSLTYLEKRDYFLYQFPIEFQKRILENTDLKKKIPILAKIVLVKGKLKMFNASSVSKSYREQMLLEFDSLLLEDPELAQNILMYSFYKEDLRFGPEAINIFFSTNFLSSFPDYIDRLRGLREYIDTHPAGMERFLEQFAANNPYLFPHYNDKEESRHFQILQDGTLKVTKSYCRNWMSETEKPHKYINYKKKFYKEAGGDDEYVFYTPAKTVTGYSAQLDLDQLEKMNKQDKEKLEKIMGLSKRDIRDYLRGDTEERWTSRLAARTSLVETAIYMKSMPFAKKALKKDPYPTKEGKENSKDIICDDNAVSL